MKVTFNRHYKPRLVLFCETVGPAKCIFITLANILQNFQSGQIDSSDAESAELAKKAWFSTLTACTSIGMYTHSPDNF